MGLHTCRGFPWAASRGPQVIARRLRMREAGSFISTPTARDPSQPQTLNPKPCRAQKQGAMRPEAEQPRPAVQSATVGTLTEGRVQARGASAQAEQGSFKGLGFTQPTSRELIEAGGAIRQRRPPRRQPRQRLLRRRVRRRTRRRGRLLPNVLAVWQVAGGEGGARRRAAGRGAGRDAGWRGGRPRQSAALAGGTVTVQHRRRLWITINNRRRLWIMMWNDVGRRRLWIMINNRRLQLPVE